MRSTLWTFPNRLWKLQNHPSTPYFTLRWGNQFISTRSVKRGYSTSHEPESYAIECGSAGEITVDLYNRHKLDSTTEPLFIHFPSSPAHLPGNDVYLQGLLASCPVAQVNYRWKHTLQPLFSARDLPRGGSGFNYCFPTPLHDSLYAYTWIINSLLSSAPAPSGGNLPRQIYVCGSHLGGTLATSIALTECFHGHHNRIVGLIVCDGIFDWTGVATERDPMASPNSGRGLTDGANEATFGKGEWDLQSLHDLKLGLFTQPSQCFDPFASPMLFFRTSGFSVPSAFLGTPEARALRARRARSPLAAYYYYSSPLSPSFPLSRPPSPEEQEEANPQSTYWDEDEEILLTRKSPLFFPPRDSGLKIPRTIFFNTNTQKGAEPQPPQVLETHGEKRPRRGVKDISPTSVHQARDMARLMRRSLRFHEFRDRRGWDEELEDRLDGLLEKRVTIKEMGPQDTSDFKRGVMKEWLGKG